MDIIVTTFLTKGKDPQRELNWDKDDFSIMEKFLARLFLGLKPWDTPTPPKRWPLIITWFGVLKLEEIP